MGLYEPLDQACPVEVSITAEAAVTGAVVRLMQFTCAADFEHKMGSIEYFWLDQCITPRPAGVRGCFPERMGGHGFIPLGDLIVVPPNERFLVRNEGEPLHGAAGHQESIVCCLDRGGMEKWCDNDLVWERWTSEALDVCNQSLRGLGFASPASFCGAFKRRTGVSPGEYRTRA